MANPNTESGSKSNTSSMDFKNRSANGEFHLDKVAQAAGDRVSEMASSLVDTTAQSIESSREYVKRNPVKGIAAAAAAGAVVGSLLTMYMGRSKN